MSLTISEKHRLYEASVQCHESDIDFLNEEFEKEYGKKPLVLREDFGGTAAMACDWVKQSSAHVSKSIDLDDEPIGYGLENHYSRLSEDEKNRMEYVKGNVLDQYNFEPDIVVAFNFSYFIFKNRKLLLDYFRKVRVSLSDEGAFFLDIFGGTEARDPLEEETEHDDFSYIWDCDSYNPLTNECLYYIHFKTHKDGIEHRQVFTYDWRMWTVPELKEILEDAGFSKITTYWEGDDADGGGDGNFFRTTKVENCESWVTYLMATP